MDRVSGEFGKHGPSYALPLLFRITAHRIAMSCAVERVDDWRRDGARLTGEANQTLYCICEAWARNERLDADTENSDAIHIGAVIRQMNNRQGRLQG